MLASQQTRFGDHLNSALRSDVGAAKCREFGRGPEVFGSHSIRKGSTTYALNGTTAAPSNGAISLRGTWSQHGARDRYVKYAEPQDSYLGRVLAGLDVTSVRFASLPPHFDSLQFDENVLPVVFPAFAVVD